MTKYSIQRNVPHIDKKKKRIFPAAKYSVWNHTTKKKIYVNIVFVIVVIVIRTTTGYDTLFLVLIIKQQQQHFVLPFAMRLGT